MAFVIVALLVVAIGALGCSIWRFARVRRQVQPELYGQDKGYNALSVAYLVLMAFFLVAYVAYLIHWLVEPMFTPIVYLITSLLFFGSVFVGLSVSVIAKSINVVLGVKRNEVDTMTGLMTKNGFEMVAQRILDEGAGEWSLVVLDMDKFKAINDEYGHRAGDELIRCVADIIRSTVRVGDMVGRFGGDEFLVLFRDMDTSQVSGIMARIESAISRVKEEKGCGVSGGISYGVAALKGGSKERYASVFEQADRALYEMKDKKREIE